MNYLVAVSGGVDSVVLLDILSRSEHHLIVAHVDHGIRTESQSDARFVEALARQYKLPYVSCQLNLGPEASEDQARRERYQFLEAQAKHYKAKIVTAHHQDDLIGSIAINLHRGTGWRGLNVMSRTLITRPLLGWTKQKIYRYALDKRLEWVEDESNSSAQYLRNRLRADLLALSIDDKTQLVRLRARQKQLASEIDKATCAVLQRANGQRYFYTMISENVAVEVLRSEIASSSGTRPTADAALRALRSIKTARPGSLHEISSHTRLRFNRRSFVVEYHPEVLK